MTPILATFLWLADKFGKDAIESGVQLGWDAARWQRAAGQYADKIECDYGRLPIFGKDRYVPIDDIYTYVHVLDQEDAYFQFAEDQLSQLYIRRDLSYDPDKRQNGWPLVADGDDLFILGDPGAGKTTFLKMAAIKAARGELRRQDDAPTRIPIFITLRQHARTDRSLYESVKHELNVCGFPEADTIVDFLLRSGRALLLWDALDEVATDEDQRSILVAEMHDFMRKYDRCQYVISCRIAAADYTFHERRLRYVKMAPFSDNQIERYLKNWFGDKHELATDCVEELHEERHKGLRELARTPILLTLLAIAYEETLSFPSRRVDIYYQAIEALLRKWDADRGIRRGQEVYAGLELGYKWDLMTEVAADAFNNGEYLLTRQEWGDRIRDYLEALPGISPGVDGGLVLDDMAARHGLFVQQTPRLYSLPHLSFQEYFTARDIKENIQHGSLERLLDHMGEDQWREIFLLTASSLRRKDAENFFNLFVERLQRMAADVEPIECLLDWANEKAKQSVVATKKAYRLVSLRAWFLALALKRRPHRRPRSHPQTQTRPRACPHP